jgi:cell shape-determining protein MreC
MNDKNDDKFEKRDGVLLNTNYSSLNKYKLVREKAAREKQLENKVNSLEQELTDIKSLLKDIHSRIS